MCVEDIRDNQVVGNMRGLEYAGTRGYRDELEGCLRAIEERFDETYQQQAEANQQLKKMKEMNKRQAESNQQLKEMNKQQAGSVELSRYKPSSPALDSLGYLLWSSGYLTGSDQQLKESNKELEEEIKQLEARINDLDAGVSSYKDFRNRFISTFKGDKLNSVDAAEIQMIAGGSRAAHYGN
jgi:predicted nuclease with TOPRIM domain